MPQILQSTGYKKANLLVLRHVHICLSRFDRKTHIRTKGNGNICEMVNKQLFKKPLGSRVTDLWKQVYRNHYKRDVFVCVPEKRRRRGAPQPVLMMPYKEGLSLSY